MTAPPPRRLAAPAGVAGTGSGRSRGFRPNEQTTSNKHQIDLVAPLPAPPQRRAIATPSPHMTKSGSPQARSGRIQPAPRCSPPDRAKPNPTGAPPTPAPPEGRTTSQSGRWRLGQGRAPPPRASQRPPLNTAEPKLAAIPDAHRSPTVGRRCFGEGQRKGAANASAPLSLTTTSRSDARRSHVAPTPPPHGAPPAREWSARGTTACRRQIRAGFARQKLLAAAGGRGVAGGEVRPEGRGSPPEPPWGGRRGGTSSPLF